MLNNTTEFPNKKPAWTRGGLGQTANTDLWKGEYLPMNQYNRYKGETQQFAEPVFRSDGKIVGQVEGEVLTKSVIGSGFGYAAFVTGYHLNIGRSSSEVVPSFPFSHSSIAVMLNLSRACSCK